MRRVQDPAVCGNKSLVMSVFGVSTAGSEGRPIDWGAMLETHGGWLRLTIMARLRDRNAADEVMQEVALAAVAQRAPLRDESKAAAWLRRLAVRQALLYRRGRGRRERLIARHAGRMGARDGAEQGGAPLDWLVRDERAALVRAALDRLPPREAEILLLKYVEGWNYREIAGRTGLTESAVEARLHRARARLRGELASMTAFEGNE